MDLDTLMYEHPLLSTAEFIQKQNTQTTFRPRADYPH